VHDGICQTITGIKLSQLNFLKENETLDAGIKQGLQENIKLIEQLYNEARDVSHELAPSGIVHGDVKNLIRDICQRMFLDIKYTINDDNFPNHVFKNEDNKKLHLVRVFQELTTNIVKHSRATEVRIQIYKRHEFIIFRVEDNGIGLGDAGVASLEEGVGLQSLGYRIKMLEGSVRFEDNDGLVCLIKIPVSESLS